MATSEGAAVVSVTCVVMVGPFGYLYRQAISPETHLAYKLDPRMSRLGPFSDMQNGPGMTVPAPMADIGAAFMITRPSFASVP
jgi:hypothetical protein